MPKEICIYLLKNTSLKKMLAVISKIVIILLMEDLDPIIDFCYLIINHHKNYNNNENA